MPRENCIKENFLLSLSSFKRRGEIFVMSSKNVSSGDKNMVEPKPGHVRKGRRKNNTKKM